MNPRTNHRRAGRAPSHAVAFASIAWLVACSNTSVDVLSARDAGGGTDGDAIVDATVDTSLTDVGDVSVGDVSVDASLTDAGDVAVDTRPERDVGDVPIDAGPDGDGGVACRALGAACTYAGACCSLSCRPADVQATCAPGPICTAAGGTCATNTDCCANLCESNLCTGVTPGACLPVGELCSSAAECCGGRCTAVTGGITRCIIGTSCRLRGETCAEQMECCSGVCFPDPRGVQICAETVDGAAEPSITPGPLSSRGAETE